MMKEAPSSSSSSADYLHSLLVDQMRDKPSAKEGGTRKRLDTYDFPGYGKYDAVTSPPPSSISQISDRRLAESSKHRLLNALEATSISGNDILSSVFYTAGLVTLNAGKLAPVCLLCVGLVLYLFRGIYAETVTALPCNGGTYNILLNCTSKQFASLAATCGIISYIATGVVSAITAIAYLQTVWTPHFFPSAEDPDGADKKRLSVMLLGVFCLLTNVGLGESATVAKWIFLAHLGTLVVLCVVGVIFFANNTHTFNENLGTPFPDVNAGGRTVTGTVFTALFYGFSSAMLGVTGFETSSQFVEEQAPGVFVKTLKYMWMSVFVINPVLSVICFAALDLDAITSDQDVVLANTARAIGDWIKSSTGSSFDVGDLFSTWLSIDAFVVLSGSVLTAYVGINGLIRRMALDRCLPQSLLYKNPVTHTDSVILCGFFGLCVSQVLLLNCDVEALGGVYCFAFLSVMTIFAAGNMILKVKRPSLPRTYSVSWLHSFVGCISVIIALLGNIFGKPELLLYFFVYFVFVFSFVLIMFKRVALLRLAAKVLSAPPSNDMASKTMRNMYSMLSASSSPYSSSSPVDGSINTAQAAEPLLPVPAAAAESNVALRKSSLRDELLEHCRSGNDGPATDADLESSQPPAVVASGGCLQNVIAAIAKARDTPFVFYLKHDDLYILNKAVMYVALNETTSRLIVVHCCGAESRSMSVAELRENKRMMGEHVQLIDVLYPKTRISLLLVQEAFSLDVVEWLSEELAIPTNAMFISCPDETFALKLSQLRGMRIITHNE